MEYTKYDFLVCMVILHSLVYIFNMFIKTCLHAQKSNLLKSIGFEIKPFRIHWYTTWFNRIIQKWGSIRPKLLLAWFSTGSFVAIALVPLAVFMLIRSMYLNLRNVIHEDNSEIGIGTFQPMMPGVNIPFSELPYYLVTLLLCTIVHELGHAIAAVREDGRVIGVGVVVVFCVPVAFVSLENMDLLSSARQLRILCAGAWHNVILALYALLANLATPWLLYPFYDWGSSVQIQTLHKNSPVNAVGGLATNDLVVQINECHVADVSSWQKCLVNAVQSSTPGYCLHSEFIKEYDESVPAHHLTSGRVECCGDSLLTHLCFEYLESVNEPLQLPQFSCLNARKVTEHSIKFCNRSQSCENDLHCFQPSLENTTKLVNILTKSGKKVLFLGHPAEVYQTVSVSDYVSLYNSFPSSVPDRIHLFCSYITSFSFGMALLNIIPCFYFDGQHITRLLMDIHFTKHIKHSSVRHALSLCFTFTGTLTLCVYLTLTFWTALK